MKWAILLLLWSVAAPVAQAATTDAERVQKKIAKQRYPAAIRLAERLLKKEGLSRITKRALWDKLAEATYLDIEAAPNPVRLQLFLTRFSRHARAWDAIRLQADLALADAKRIGTQAALVGVLRTYPNTEAGKSARSLAAEMGHKELSRASDTNTLRKFWLRYQGTPAAKEIQRRELDTAYETTKMEGTATAWQAFIDRYPDHEHIDEAIGHLHQQSWEDVDQQASSASQLWAYAARFPDTEQAWNAADRALNEGLQWSWAEDRPLGSLRADLGGMLPPGWSVDLVLSVKSGETQVPWSEAITQWTPLVGGTAAPPDIGRVELERVGQEVIWRTPYAICSPDGTPTEVQARLILQQGARMQHWTQNFLVSAACPGARRMLFAAHPDDVIGPFGVLRYRAASGKYELETAAVEIPDAWDCSHISEVDQIGVTMVCGRSTVRIGWNKGELWLRSTDAAQATTTRADLNPLSVDRRLGISQRRGALLDRGGNQLAQLDGRSPVVTPIDLSGAFEWRVEEVSGTPMIPPAEEQARSAGRHPVPKGSTASPVSFTSTSYHEQRRLAPAVQALLGEPVSIPQKLNNGMGEFFVLKGPSEEGHITTIGLLVPMADEEGWIQFLPLMPGIGETQAQWMTFEHGGHQYLRAVGVSPVRGRRVRMFTFRSVGDHFATDVTDLR